MTLTGASDETEQSFRYMAPVMTMTMSMSDHLKNLDQIIDPVTELTLTVTVTVRLTLCQFQNLCLHPFPLF